MRMTRRDALPEYAEYRDEGCSVASACLSCPLLRCQHDERRRRNVERNAAIVELRRSGMPIDRIAKNFGVGRRTVFRVLAGGADA
jgi:hypothetical protein